MGQGHVLPHLTEIVDGYRHLSPGLGLGDGGRHRSEKHRPQHHQDKPEKFSPNSNRFFLHEFSADNI